MSYRQIGLHFSLQCIILNFLLCHVSDNSRDNLVRDEYQKKKIKEYLASAIKQVTCCQCVLHQAPLEKHLLSMCVAPGATRQIFVVNVCCTGHYSRNICCQCVLHQAPLEKHLLSMCVAPGATGETFVVNVCSIRRHSRNIKIRLALQLYCNANFFFFSFI